MTAPSPFLPGTKIQYAWDSTSLGWLKECPRKYQYHMIEGWRSKGESVHLTFGIWFHEALEYYDKLRVGYIICDEERTLPPQTHDEALIEVIYKSLKDTWIRKTPDDYEVDQAGTNQMVPKVGAGQPWSTDHALKTRENLIRAVIWYLDHFERDNAKTLQLANGKPAVELSFKMELDFGPKKCLAIPDIMAEDPIPHHYTQPYLLCGHLDRVVDFSGGTYVMDRKTTTTTPGSYYFDQYEPDNQMTIYTIAAKIVFDTPVRGVIIDAVQIAVGFTRFVRGMTYRTPAQIEEWLADLHSWLAQAEGYAVADHWPMNDKSCHKYGGCAFRKVCSKDPSVRKNFLESDFERQPWNPLEVR